MIRFEKEICDYLQIPSIPIKKWNGKDSFRNGVGIVKLALGDFAYAVCRYDNEADEKPKVVKYFATEPFYEITDIFIVPNYMEVDVENADLDEESKKAAQRLADEAIELTAMEEENEMDALKTLPEWIFPEIHNLEEAQAWLKNYNTMNKLKGRIPTSKETIILRLYNIHSQMKK